MSNYNKTTIRVGGIVGYLTGTVSECANYANVSGDILLPCEGTSCAGGVAGETSDATIQNCYNKGTITSQVAKASSSSNEENVLFSNGTNNAVQFWYAIPKAGDWLYYKIVGGQTEGKDGTFKDAKKSTSTKDVYGAYTGGMVGYVNKDTTVSGCLNMGEVSRKGRIKRRYNLNYKIRWSSKNDMYNDGFLINQNFSYTESGLFGPITGWGGKISNCYDYYNAGANFKKQQYSDLELTQKIIDGNDLYDSKAWGQMNGACPDRTTLYKWVRGYKYTYTHNFGCKATLGGNTLYFYINTPEYAFVYPATVYTYGLKEYDSYPISNSWTPNTTNVTKGYPSDSSIWNDNHELKNLFW